MWAMKTIYTTTGKCNLTHSVLPVGLVGSNPKSLNWKLVVFWEKTQGRSAPQTPAEESSCALLAAGVYSCLF